MCCCFQVQPDLNRQNIFELTRNFRGLTETPTATMKTPHGHLLRDLILL